jgi:hypothetical protein
MLLLCPTPHQVSRRTTGKGDRMSHRAGAAGLFAVALLGLAGCGSSTQQATGGLTTVAPTTTTSPSNVASSTPTAVTTPTVTVTTPTAPAVAPLKCAQLKTALVGSTSIAYQGYHDSIPLSGGTWNGEDGNTVTLETPCAIGDLDGDGAADAVGVVVLSSGGTGQFYTLVVWRDAHGSPVFTALADLDDRNPVQSIAIAHGKATVVYLTRTADAPMAEVNLKRTAVYKLSGHHFTELSHTDVPYSH